MAACQSLTILCSFSLSLLLLLNPSNCQDSPPSPPATPTPPATPATPSSANGTTTDLGPWGNTATDNILPWRFTLGENETIVSVVVKASDIVDCIGFTIVDGNGYITTKMYGNVATSSYREIAFEEGESIVQISGKHAGYNGNGFRRTISQLTIHTDVNTRGYGPFGRGSGLLNFREVEDFQSPLIAPGAFAGLYGTIGTGKRFVESIGLTAQTA